METQFKRYVNFLVFLVVFGLFFSFYLNQIKTIPFSFYDEFWWISDSYLAEYYFKGDFKSFVWKSTDARHQPMFTRLVFASVLYPDYMSEKNQLSDSNVTRFSYSQYLIKNGFFYSELNGGLGKKTPVIDKDEVGFEDHFVNKYGPLISKPLDMIKKIRSFNAFLLAFTVSLIFMLLRIRKGTLFALLYTAILATNNILVESSLKAHSEAIFVLLFVLSIIFMYKVAEIPCLKNAFYTSVIIGLTTATKLNGIFLYPILLILIVKDKPPKNLRNLGVSLKRIFISLCGVFLTFIILNPYVFQNPLAKILDMYMFRYSTAQWQSKFFLDSGLTTVYERFIAAYTNLFSSYGDVVGPIVLVVFVLGIIGEFKKPLSKDTLSYIILVSFLVLSVSMAFYLKVNWPRYYIPLVFYVGYFVISGLQVVVSWSRSTLLKRTLYAGRLS